MIGFFSTKSSMFEELHKRGFFGNKTIWGGNVTGHKI